MTTSLGSLGRTAGRLSQGALLIGGTSGRPGHRMCSSGLGLSSLLTLKFSALLGSQTVNNLLGLLLLLLRVGQQLGLLIALTLNRRAISLSLGLHGFQSGLLSLEILELHAGALRDVLNGRQFGQELPRVATCHKLSSH